VSHLILWCAFSNGSDARQAPLSAALDNLLNVDYALFCETLAHSFFGWEEGESAHRFALYMQDAMSQEEARRQWTGTAEHGNVEDLLPLIQAPTLVLHRRDLPVLGVDVARRLAARIPHARLKIIDGSSLSPYVGDINAAIEPIRDFLGAENASNGERPRRPHPHPGDAAKGGVAGGFRTIMFTDMEGSTALTQRLGDAAAQELVRLHDAIVNDALATFGGKHVKHTGDGIMASFATASSAVECAIAIQQAFGDHNDATPTERVAVRIGINAGEPVQEGDDLFGTAVQLARRVCDAAAAGEILTSDVVRQLVAGKGFLFAERGEAAMRGFEDPVRVYEVRWHNDRS
jgi:class 3 adenylate cyclase